MSARRPLLHLDAAGASRSSRAVVASMIDHLEQEVALGGYEAETAASERIQHLRADLASIVGLSADDVALTASASDGFLALVRALRVRPGGRIGLLLGSYHSNRLALEALAARTGVELVELAVDGDHRLDIPSLEAELARGLDVVYVDHVASQRGVVQPAARVVQASHAAGAAVVIDVAQAVGQLDVAGLGADAYVATSRKWLRGPRGAGFVAVAPDGVLPFEPELEHALTWRWIDGGWRDPQRPVARLERGETSVAARVGLAVAVQELLIDTVQARHERIVATARAVRRAAADRGWTVGEPLDEPCGIVTLRPADGDVATARADRLGRGVLTGFVPATRAADLDGEWLRVAAGHEHEPGAVVDALAL